MKQTMIFNPDLYQDEQVSIGGDTIHYRAFRGLSYCEHPKDEIQKINIFVPADYYEGKTIHGFTIDTAPILMPNTVGGYMPGPAGEPGKDMMGKPNIFFAALQHGYIVAAAGVRGRTTGRKSNDFFVGGSAGQPGSEDGELCGKAPAFLIDMKAAIRWLRLNKKLIPGDTEKIFTDGTSAGGALSALTGATGNHPDYAPYLSEIGAAKERDDIFGAVCFCPITNLEHADCAYEWQFQGTDEAHFMKFSFDEEGQIHMEPLMIPLSEEQRAWSDELAADFPEYLNRLEMTDRDGTPLTLDADGNGTFKDFIVRKLIVSAQHEVNVDLTTAKRLGWENCCDTNVKELPYLTFDGDQITGLDWDGYIHAITRMKTAPAFDHPELTSPENDEFGTPQEPAKHFTAFSLAHTKADGTPADDQIIRMMNPIPYIKDPQADTALHWWIRHGSYDRDTSLAISAILAVKLENSGADVNHKFPWGLPHSGDYDLDQLFAWIDDCCR